MLKNPLKSGDSLLQNSENPRITYARNHRALYKGDFTQLGISLSAKDIGGIRVNLFRRVADFFAEFIWSKRPIIVNQEDLTKQVSLLSPRFQNMNVDMLRYGTGIISSDPYNPLMVRRWDSDQHYESEDGTHQFIVNRRLLEANQPYLKYEVDKSVVDLFTFKPNGEVTLQVCEGGNSEQIGTVLSTVDLPQRSPSPQVIFAYPNLDKTSIFDDMMPHVAEISRTLARLSTTLDKNLDPHMYGPDGLLTVDERGRAQVDKKGMYFPLSPGDETPGVIQWEAMPEAVEFTIKQHENFAYETASLTRMLFDPEGSNVGSLSGQALRRLLIPFYSRILHLSEVNRVALAETFQMLTANGALLGNQIPDIAFSDIEVEWGYTGFFADLDEAEPSEETGELTSGA